MLKCVADLDDVFVVVLGPGVAPEADLGDGPDIAGGQVVKDFVVTAGTGSPVDGGSACLAETLDLDRDS